MLFPTFFDDRLVAEAPKWLESGMPPLTPTYVRNFVEFFVLDIMPSVVFRPWYQLFYLEDGKEVLIGERQSGWINKGAGVVNPASWAEKSRYNLDDVRLMAQVDPSLPDRTAPLVEKNLPLLLKEKLADFARGVFEKYVQSQVPGDHRVDMFTSTRTPKNGHARFAADGGLFVSSGWYVVPARYEAGKIFFPALSMWGDEPEVVEASEELWFAKGVEPPVHHVALYAEKFASLKAAVAAACSKAREEGVRMEIPQTEKLEKGYPKQEMPAQLHIKIGAGTLATTDHLQRWFEAACRMAEALGYEKLSDYTSRHSGRTKSADYVLVGKADPKSLNSFITRVDYDKGFLYCQDKRSRRDIVGEGGVEIRRIERLSGRRWTVVVG